MNSFNDVKDKKFRVAIKPPLKEIWRIKYKNRDVNFSFTNGKVFADLSKNVISCIDLYSGGIEFDIHKKIFDYSPNLNNS